MRMDGLAYITELADLLDKNNLPYPEAVVLNNNMYEDIEESLNIVGYLGKDPVHTTRMRIREITIIKGVSNV